MDTEERDRLHKELVKLADILETCKEGSDDWKTYQREYRKVAKILYPEMYRNKTLRKPRPAFISTLKKCTCGTKTIRLRKTNGGYQFSCFACDIKSEVQATQALARDSWNKTFENGNTKNN
jgi:hypothetical protein